MDPTGESVGVNLLCLLESGRFSDLRLICEGRSYDVHKNILCEQSRVISAACEGSFKESRTNVINIEEFNADTVYTMLQFLYSRDYSVPRDSEDVSLGRPVKGPVKKPNGKPVNLAPVDEPVDEPLDEHPEAAVDKPLDDELMDVTELVQALSMHNAQQRLHWHLNANSIGDYYDIQGLCDLSRSRVEKEFDASWSPELFLYLLKACTTRKTGDSEFYRLLGHLGAERQEDLVGAKELERLDMPPAFWMSFISSSSERIQFLQENIRSLQEDIRNMDEPAEF